MASERLSQSTKPAQKRKRSHYSQVNDPSTNDRVKVIDPENGNDLEWAEICGGQDCCCLESMERNLSDYLELQKEILRESSDTRKTFKRFKSSRRSKEGLKKSQLQWPPAAALPFPFTNNKLMLGGKVQIQNQPFFAPLVLCASAAISNRLSRFCQAVQTRELLVKGIAHACFCLVIVTAALTLLLPMLFTQEFIQERFFPSAHAHSQWRHWRWLPFAQAETQAQSAVPEYLLETMLWLQSQINFLPVDALRTGIWRSTHAQYKFESTWFNFTWK